jgi:trans-aconitate methyltransferase
MLLQYNYHLLLNGMVMSTTEWPADEYAVGSYIQTTVANRYFETLPIRPTDHVLDVGCGDGSYSRKILEHFPMKSLTGIDASKNMIALAKKTVGHFPNVNLQHADIMHVDFEQKFDCIVSFWCLQWSKNIKLALQKIYLSLNKGGRFFAIFPTGDDPFMTMFQIVRDSGQFKNLKNFKLPLDYSQFSDLREKVYFIPFMNPSVERTQHSITLPSLDIYRKFVNGIAFYHGQIHTDEIQQINEAMVEAFAENCLQRFDGKLRFEFTTYIVKGEK